VYSIQHYVIKFVSDLQKVGSFLWFSSNNKTNRHDISEILLIVALDTIHLPTSNIMCGDGDEDLIIARTKEDDKGGSRISS
jgi:hypothetical protein